MTVRYLLSSITSRELAEWHAYERLNGPFDESWRDELRAQSVEFQHDQLYLTGQAHFTDKNHRKGPIDQREERIKRPSELFED